MFCEKCGEKIEDNVKFCPKCGNPTGVSASDLNQVIDNVINDAQSQALGAINEVKATLNGSDNGGKLKDNWGLLSYILLSIITCGLYNCYIIHKIGKDINVACDGDGETTSGLLKFILFTIITCGIYSWIWYYKLGNRLASNSGRYGLTFQENGTTILLWFLFGSLLCGIGPFIALNIIFKNTNKICNAYNTTKF